MDTTKAVGIARQSRGDGASIEEQTARIREHCKREGWKLVNVIEEQDVSGGKPLAKRVGLLEAVEAVEAGKASVIVVAYFDRLVRSLKVQIEVAERVEAAGGKILTLDVGEISHASAASKLSASMLGQVAEYHRDTTAERVKAAHERLTAEGKWTGGKIPLGIRKDDDGRLAVDDATAPFVREAFARRDRGETFEQVRGYLREATGLPVKSLIVVTRMLSNEVYIEHGIVDRPLFKRVQTMHSKRGTRPASTRLLARLNVLHCSCGARMVVHGSEPNKTYRCGGQSCDAKAAVSCHIAERVVVHAVRVALRDREGRSGVNLEALQAEADRRRELFAAAVEGFSALVPTEVTQAKLGDLQAGVTAAEDALADGREVAGHTIHGGVAWEGMGAEMHRHLIRLAVETCVVAPGRGEDRIQVTLAAAFDPEPVLDAHAADVVAARSPSPPSIEALLREVVA
jgi:DNA invertase Pin-like site-specific DNA recombinase